jgi:glutamine amidotransferase
MIGVIDYGMGNVSSINNMIKKIGKEVVLISDPSLITQFDTIILPGVGSFDHGMSNLRKLGFETAINNHVKQKKKIIGICLGMQMLGLSSEEGIESGLGLIAFKSVRFKFKESKLKVSHMGWNYVEYNGHNVNNRKFETKSRFYFVHSYHALCDREEDVLMWTQYGYKFASAVKKENVIGFQFHPEKSHIFGMELLKTYLNRDYNVIKT